MNFISILLKIILLIGATVNQVHASEERWNYKDWIVNSGDKLVQYTASGNTVNGHKFGFIKKSGNCNDDLLWLTWSSNKKDINEFKGKDVLIRFRIDNDQFQLAIPLVSVVKNNSALTSLAFTNFMVAEKFISQLKNGANIEVSIIAPKELSSKLDISKDTFSLNGFIAARLKSQEYCNTLKVSSKNPVVSEKSSNAISVISSKGDKLDYFIKKDKFYTSEGRIPNGCFAQLMTELNGDDAVAAVFINRTTLRGCIAANSPYAGEEDKISYEITSSMGNNVFNIKVCESVEGSMGASCDRIIVEFKNRKYTTANKILTVLSLEKLGEW